MPAIPKALAWVVVCCAIVIAISQNAAAAADNAAEQAVLQADRNMMQAAGQADKAAFDRLTDSDFTWISTAGTFRAKDEILHNFPKPAIGSGANVVPRNYGPDL